MAITPITIFYSYSHRDEAFKEQLENHLALLRRKSLIKTWHDRRIIPGQEWETAIENHLDEADIVLLLVSADFIASDYCYGREVLRAMERHERNEAKVIPVVVRAVDWSDAPFGRLQALPKDAHPVTSWNNQDEAWLDVEKGIKKAIEELQDIKYRDTSTSTLTSIRDVLATELKQLEEIYVDTKTNDVFCEGIPTGIRDLDILLSGLRSAELIVIAARPSMGKSDFVVNIVARTAIFKNQTVAFFSLQMPAQRVTRRLIASTSGINSHRMWSGYLGERDFPRIAAAVGRFFEAPLYIDESPRLTILEIRDRAKSLKAEKEIRLLIIDSLQQLVTSGTVTINDSIVALKSLAKELQIPVVVTSNVSRNVDERPDKRPILSDLGEWGNLEQEADVLLFLYRDEVYNPQEYNRGTLDVIIAKNRNGPVDIIKASYLPEISKICDLASSEDEYYEEQE